MRLEILVSIFLFFIPDIGYSDPIRVIMPETNKISGLFVPEGAGKWTPSSEQVQELERRLPNELASSKELSSSALSRLASYGRQYLGTDKDRRKRIFVNAFCSDGGMAKETLRITLLSVFDGGECYFQIFYDPVTKKFEELTVNGEA